MGKRPLYPSPVGCRPQCSRHLSRLFLLLWMGAVWDHLGLCVEPWVFSRPEWGYAAAAAKSRLLPPEPEGSQRGAGGVDEPKGSAPYCRVGVLERNRDGCEWAQLGLA